MVRLDSKPTVSACLSWLLPATGASASCKARAGYPSPLLLRVLSKVSGELPFLSLTLRPTQPFLARQEGKSLPVRKATPITSIDPSPPSFEPAVTGPTAHHPPYTSRSVQCSTEISSTFLPYGTRTSARTYLHPILSPASSHPS